MNKFISLKYLNQLQKSQYRNAMTEAFPSIIGESPIIKKYWKALENCFPQYQFLLISSNHELIGFMNTVPFHFNHDLNQLPERGWDWMLKKGITDFEDKIAPNYLGGLQVIVRSKFKNQGYSKVILSYAKRFLTTSSFTNLVIPIRPTNKHKFPTMPMREYLDLKNENEVYDPWIRTHLKGGAEVIKVCERSMIMDGNIEFWKTILKKKSLKSGQYTLSGALNLISIDVENDIGVYVEPNIWIKY